MITRDELKSLSYEDLRDISYEELLEFEIISKKFKEDGLKGISYEELQELELKLWDIRWHTRSWIVRKIVEKALNEVVSLIIQYERVKE